MGQVLRQPLTRAQRALWAAQQATPLCPINIALCIELTGNLDAELLRAVTLGVARQTGIAFTHFEQTERGIEQVIDRGLSDHITMKDLRTEPDPDAAGHQWMRDDYGVSPVDESTRFRVFVAPTWGWKDDGHHGWTETALRGADRAQVASGRRAGGGREDL